MNTNKNLSDSMLTTINESAAALRTHEIGFVSLCQLCLYTVTHTHTHTPVSIPEDTHSIFTPRNADVESI